MVTTQPKNHQTKAKAVRDTWGQKCDVLFFVSSKSDPSYPIIEVKCETEDHSHLWCKNRKGFVYGFNKYRDQFDWFVKADDDTYMVIDNLRLLLNDYDANDPLLFGLPFKYNGIVYPSGGMSHHLERIVIYAFVSGAGYVSYQFNSSISVMVILFQGVQQRSNHSFGPKTQTNEKQAVVSHEGTGWS